MANRNVPCLAGSVSPAQLETQPSAEFKHASQGGGVALPQHAAAVASYSSSPTESMGDVHCLQHTGSALSSIKPAQVLGNSAVVLEDADAMPMDCDVAAEHTPSRPSEVRLSNVAAHTGLTSPQDDVTPLVLPVEAQGMQVGLSAPHDTADAGVQVNEACSPQKSHRASERTQRVRSCQQNAGCVMPDDTARDCCRQDLSLETQLANVPHHPSYTNNSTATQTDSPGVELSAVQRPLGLQDHCATLFERHATLEKTCIPGWQFSVPRDVAVVAPDPGVLLAVQGVRAQLEALNQEMASVMLHPPGASRMTPEGNASPAQTEACGGSRTDAGTDATATADLNEWQPMGEWTFKPAADELRSQTAHPITISVSVSAAAPDHRMHAVPGNRLCRHAQQIWTDAGVQCSEADQFPMETRRTGQTEDKACQISVEDAIIYLQQTALASPASPTSEPARPTPVRPGKVSRSDAGIVHKEPCGVVSTSIAERVCVCFLVLQWSW